MNLTQDKLIALAKEALIEINYSSDGLEHISKLAKFAELLTNRDAEPVEVVTDEEIQAAFNNTNFGRTDFKMILLEGVDKTALGYHNGWTLTQIIRNLGLGVASSSDSNRITRKGLDFIVQCRASHSKAEQDAELIRNEVKEALKCVYHSEMLKRLEAIANRKDN